MSTGGVAQSDRRLSPPLVALRRAIWVKFDAFGHPLDAFHHAGAGARRTRSNHAVARANAVRAIVKGVLDFEHGQTVGNVLLVCQD